jgi:hypothetical protein
MARVVGIRWDTRAIPVKYSVNNTLDPIPNLLGPPFISLGDATAELQASFDVWNDVRTSFIEMLIAGNTSNPGLPGFDFVNEITFRTSAGFGAIAISPSVVLVEDTTFVEGDDVDEDGDSDVSSGIAVTTDVDGDGDLEFPAGFYRAGTILDNDVQFNTKPTNGFRFTINAADADTDPRSTDLGAIAVHEFGHSHGLAHSAINQRSGTDGNGATMFPVLDTGDPIAELAQRTPAIDDIAYSSFLYREGTKRRGPGALQKHDVAFDRVFGLIKGHVRHGLLEQPLAGAHVFAVNLRDQTAGTSAISGTTQVSFDPVTGGLFVFTDPADGIVNGKFVIPLPRGRYRLGIEPVDGQPVSVSSTSVAAQLGNLYGQHIFNEEFPLQFRERHHSEWFDDGDDRHQPPDRITVRAGETRRHVNIRTNTDINIDNFGDRDFLGFVSAPAGRIYAVRVPAAQIMAASQGGWLSLDAVAFDTGIMDASEIPRYAEAMVTTGVVNPDGTASLELFNPLVQSSDFLGQDNDLAPLLLKHRRALGRRVQLGIERGQIQNLFLVLQIPTTVPFPGVSGAPPLIGLDGIPGGSNDVPIFGLSYVSDDAGATFTPVNDFNLRFSLRLGHSSKGDHDGDGRFESSETDSE